MAEGRLVFLAVLCLFTACNSPEKAEQISLSGPQGTLIAIFPKGPLEMGLPWPLKIQWKPEKNQENFNQEWEFSGNFHQVKKTPWRLNPEGAWERIWWFETFLPGTYKLDPWTLPNVGSINFPEIQVLSSAEGKDEIQLLNSHQLTSISWFLWGGLVVCGLIAGSGILFFHKRLRLKSPGLSPVPGQKEIEILESLKENFHLASPEDLQEFYRAGRILWDLWRKSPRLGEYLKKFYNYDGSQTLETWEQDFINNDRNLRFKGKFVWIDAESDLDRLLHLGRGEKAHV